MKIFSKSIISDFDRGAIDSAKGFLILCVILGHIRVLTDHVPQVFVVVNNFHVICFLLLPFLYDVRSFDKNSLNIWAGRYFVPFILFATVYGVISHIVFGGEAFFITWIKAVFIGTSIYIDGLTGMQSLWFLPTLMALVAILGLIKGLNIPILILAIAAMLDHLLVGMLSERTLLNIPFGIAQISYLFILGLALRRLFELIDIKNIQKYAPLFLLGWVLAQLIATFYTETRVGFAMMRFQSIENIGALLLHDVLILCIMCFLLTNVWLKKSRILCYLGKYSLQVYLLHHFIYGALYTLLIKSGVIFDESNSVFYGMVLFVVVIVCCVVIIEVLKRTKLMPVLFPRSLSSLFDKREVKS